RSRKLMPKYIGPYKITQSYPNESRYILDLPPELKARRIHPLFHVFRLHTFNANDNKLFPRREARAYYDFCKAEDNKWLVDKIIAHQWKGTKVSFLVQWNLGDTTWEPYSECKDLMALDRYLELLGIEGRIGIIYQGRPWLKPGERTKGSSPNFYANDSSRKEV